MHSIEKARKKTRNNKIAQLSGMVNAKAGNSNSQRERTREREKEERESAGDDGVCAEDPDEGDDEEAVCPF